MHATIETKATDVYSLGLSTHCPECYFWNPRQRLVVSMVSKRILQNDVDMEEPSSENTRKIIKIVNLPVLLPLCSIVAICCHTASCPLITSPYQPAAAAGPSIAAAAAAPVSLQLRCRITAANIQSWQARRPLSRVGKSAVLTPERLATGAVAGGRGGSWW